MNWGNQAKNSIFPNWLDRKYDTIETHDMLDFVRSCCGYILSLETRVVSPANNKAPKGAIKKNEDKPNIHWLVLCKHYSKTLSKYDEQTLKAGQ